MRPKTIRLPSQAAAMVSAVVYAAFIQVVGPLLSERRSRGRAHALRPRQLRPAQSGASVCMHDGGMAGGAYTPVPPTVIKIC